MSKTKIVILYSFCVLIGLLVPLCFAILDMWELGIESNISNIIDIAQSQNIYVFSTIFFPISFLIAGYLLVQARIANQKIEDEFEFLKIILNSSPDAIVFLNEDLEVNFRNHQFRALFDDFNVIKNELDKQGDLENTQFFQKEILLQSNISEDHPFLLSFRLTTQNDERNYFMSLKDLKSLKDKEKIIEFQNHQMLEKNRLAALGEMAAGIAHEINNPLTVIQSNNSLVRKIFEKGIQDPDRIVKLTDKNKNQIKRITDIITSLRNLSRGMNNDNFEVFAIRDIVNESINLAKIKDKQKHIEFISDISEDIKVYGNRGQIIQVILNLLSNAIDAIDSHDSPWIKVTANGENIDFVELFITDSGQGISEEIARKIFNPMFTTKEVGKGTGLGLSLSKTFIENNGGSLVYDKNHDNTCFKVILKSANTSENKKAA